ncbi:MAG: gliding motility-associated C-terminal domain-containing protein, partial [Bacteroidota bacterium]
SISVGNNAYTDAGMYSDTLQSISGCDSIVNLNLTVNPSFSMTLTETICEGESITIGNTTFTTSGNFTERLNTVNGCDSIINLSLTVVPSFEDNIEETICEGDSIVIGSSIYKADGSYSDTLQNVFGCDSIINLRLFVNPTFNRSINQSICTGDSIILGNQVLKETGVYTESFLSSNGCDSVVTIDLFVNPFINTVVDSTICEGEVIFIGDSSYSESGTYEQVFTAVGGCDSIFTLNVTVLPIYNINLNEVICEGDSVQVGNSIYNSSGNYVDTLCSVSDCDSIVNLSLLVHPSFDETIETIVCEGETVRVGNRTYTEIGNYIDTLQTVLGCDSIIRLNLTVNPTYVIDREQTICEGQAITIGEEIIETAGSYEILLQTINGCDSLINLEVKLAAEINTILNEIICEGGSIMVGETQYTTAGAYVDTLTASGGCDSIVSLFLQVIGPANQAAIATEDQSTCDAETLISAIEYSELPIAGEWRSTGGQFIVDPFSSETEVGDFNVGENIFIWSLTSEACGFDPYSTDTVVVNFDRIPIANDDEFITRRETPSLNQSIIENDILPEDWRIEFFEVPEEITVTEQDGLINIFPQDEFTGEVEFGYRLCSEACDTCDEATILVAINKNADPDSPPSYLCPTCPNPVPFEPVPCLPDCYQNDVNSIVIVNRWGDVVYEEKPFSGTWFGNNAQGVPLPAGTYYYIIRLDLGNAEILVGEIIILR